MRALPLAEFPSQGVFPLEVVAASHEAVVRNTQQSRKGRCWVEAALVLEDQVVVARLTQDRRLHVSCPTSPAASVEVGAVLTPDGLSPQYLDWICRREEIEDSAARPIPGSKWLVGTGITGLQFGTDRSKPRTAHTRCVADRQWVSACLAHLWSHTSVQVVLYADGRVWAGTPGRGRALHGTLGPDGLDLGLDDPVTTLGGYGDKSDTGEAASA